MPDAPAGYTDFIDLFDRRYRLQVFDRVITDLNIKFTVKRSLSSKVANSCELDIYNLNADSRGALQGQRDVYVSLNAGYAAGGSTIFRGDLAEAWSTRDGTEWITTITSNDGGTARKTKRIQKTYPAGSNIRIMLESIANELGLGLGNLAAVAESARFFSTGMATAPAGYTASGSALEQLERLARAAGLTFSVQDGQLQFLRFNAASADATILLSPDTGLVDSPEMGKDKTVKAKALMIPGLWPGRRLELKSRHVSGLYRIDTTTHQGELDGTEWGAELELSALKGG
jgi:hypothetical protein